MILLVLAAVEQKRRLRVSTVLIALLQLLSLVTATSSHFSAPQQGQSPESALEFRKGCESIERVVVNEWEYKGLGSTPPNCEHRCGECSPCEAIQVPATTDHLGVQYANYEPEAWKCKCGCSFFNP